MSAMTVTNGGVSGNNNSNNNNNGGSGGGNGEPADDFTLFDNRAPIWPSSHHPSVLDQHWNESIFPLAQQQQPSHRPWPSETFVSDIGGDELPYPRQTPNHHSQDFSPLPSSPATLLNGSHLGQTGRFQFPNDSSSSPYCSQSLPPMSSYFNDPLYDPSILFPHEMDRRSNTLLDSRQQQQQHQQQQQQQQQQHSSSLDNSMMSRESKLTLDQMVGRFADLQVQPLPPSAYPPYQNPFLPPSNEQQQQLLSSFYYQSSSPTAQPMPSSMVNSRLPPPQPFANHLFVNSPSSPHTQYSLAQQQNGPSPSMTSNMFNDRFDRSDGYLPFSNTSSYLPAMRYSPNPGYRTTKSGKQQIGPENANLFICHLPQETTDQSLMSLFSQFGT